jgi:hypothetical protein
VPGSTARWAAAADGLPAPERRAPTSRLKTAAAGRQAAVGRIMPRRARQRSNHPAEAECLGLKLGPRPAAARKVQPAAQ